jgi:tRNA-dihydrouridine synthase B
MHYLQTGEHYPAPSVVTIRDVMLNHMKNLYEFYGEARGILVARKHVSWYSKGQRQGGAFRHAFNQLLSASEQVEAATAFFDSQIEIN